MILLFMDVFQPEIHKNIMNIAAFKAISVSVFAPIITVCFCRAIVFCQIVQKWLFDLFS